MGLTMNKMITGLAIALAMTASQAFAGDGQVSQSGLEAFGLGGMQVVSDAEGMAVRGQASFAFVGGGSFSFLPGTGTANVYAAGAQNNNRSSTANGGSNSASTFRIRFNGNVLRVDNGSIGGASAYAK